MQHHFSWIFKVCNHINLLKKPESLETKIGRIALFGLIIAIYPTMIFVHTSTVASKDPSNNFEVLLKICAV